MTTNLFYLSDGKAHSMNEHQYETEDSLQALIADNPNIIMRDTDGSNRLFLVEREFKVQESEDTSNSYSLDHLFLDSDGVPVLVEVKRSSDTRIRREVIGQMMDYAARAYIWDVDGIRDSFLANNPTEVTEEIDTDDYWQRVASNLKAEHLRLVFVSDVIPHTLRTLIEFLDRNLSDIEVYGVEIRQYKSGSETMLSSSIIESTTTKKKRVVAKSVEWTAKTFASYLLDIGCDDAKLVAEKLRDYAQSIGFECPFGKGAKYPSFMVKARGHKVCTVGPWEYSYGFRCPVTLYLPDIQAAVDNKWSEDELRKMLSALPNQEEWREEKYLWDTPQSVYIDLKVFTNPENMEAFKAALQNIRDAIQ